LLETEFCGLTIANATFSLNGRVQLVPRTLPRDNAGNYLIARPYLNGDEKAPSPVRDERRASLGSTAKRLQTDQYQGESASAENANDILSFDLISSGNLFPEFLLNRSFKIKCGAKREMRRSAMSRSAMAAEHVNLNERSRESFGLLELADPTHFPIRRICGYNV
jgi:hypothetical protein